MALDQEVPDRLQGGDGIIGGTTPTLYAVMPGTVENWMSAGPRPDEKEKMQAIRALWSEDMPLHRVDSASFRT